MLSICQLSSVNSSLIFTIDTIYIIVRTKKGKDAETRTKEYLDNWFDLIIMAMRDESTLPACLRKKLPPNLERIKNGSYNKNDMDYPIHMYLKENDIKVDEAGSDIINFLRGKTILVTGATGFLGKLLVEKLLRCCADIDTIYIIVRTKKGKDTETRIKEYLDNWVFVKLSDIYPNFRDKVVGISGDFEQEGLGLSEESRKILTQRVNIIYHAAATVRFDENLKKAVQINIKGTQEIMKLAKECEQLDVLTHISTAYSNCIHKEIKEDFYPPVMKPQDLIEVMDKLPSDVVDKITTGILGEYPNTYAFTKHLAEDVIRTTSIGLPTCIQRPSIVIASVREPIRSWMDNIFGPAGLILAGAVGLLHIMLGNENGKGDMVPVDYVINNCIAASYKTAKDRITDKVQIFNFTTSDKKPFYWKNLGLSKEYGNKVGSDKVFKKHFIRLTKCWYWFTLLNFILHTIPAYIVDFIAVRLGKKPRLVKAYAKIHKFMNVLSYFSLNEWTFDSTNTKNLWKVLNEKDKKIFAFDMSTLDWHQYFETYAVALREFLLFDFLDSLDKGRRYFNRLFILHYLFVTAIVAFSTYYLMTTIFCFIPITIIAIILYYVFTPVK